MQHRTARNVISVFMAFVLIFTCNSATFQPLVALADSASDQATDQPAAPQGGESDLAAPGGEANAPADNSTVGNAPDNAINAADPQQPAPQPGAEGEGDGTASNGEDNAAADGEDAEQSQKPRDLSDDADALGYALKGVAYLDADGAKQLVEAQDNRVDVADVDVATATDWQLVYLMTVDPTSTVSADDYFTLRAPQTMFSLAGEDALTKANTDTDAQATYSLVEGNVRVALSAEAAEAIEPLELEVRVPVDLDADALGEESSEVELALQGEATATVVLPAQATEEPEAAAEATAPEDPPVDPGTDVTNELEQLSLDVVDFSYVDAAGVTQTIPQVQGDKGPQYNFSNVPFDSIKMMNMEVDFGIKKDDGERIIKAGDTFTYTLPGIFTVNPIKSQDIFAPNGDKLATYTIDAETNEVVVKFEQTVNIDEGNVHIVGGVACSFTLNKDKLNSENPTDEEMTLQEGGTTYTFTAPKNSTELKGIEKEGKSFNKENSTVTWTITVGSDPTDAGVPLKGIIVTDTYGEGIQKPAKATGPDGTELTVVEAEDDTGFIYTFPDDSTAVAPYELTVTTPITDEALKAAAAATGDGKEVSNTVGMSSPEGSTVTVPGEPTSTGTENVPKYSLSKTGTQLNSSTMRWELTVNEDATGAATGVVVYDQLDSRAELLPNTLKVGNEPVDVNPDLVPTDATYALTKKQSDGSTILEVHFFGTVSTEQKITFDTSITLEGEDQLQNVKFHNDAWTTYTWPGGPEIGKDDGPQAGTNPDFNVAYLNKETPKCDESTGEIEWTIRPSIRTAQYETAVITDTVETDQSFIKDSVKVEYKNKELSKETLAGGVFSYDDASHKLTFTFPKKDYSLNDIVITYKSQALNFKKENMKDHTYSNTAKLDVSVSDSPGFHAEDTASREFKNEFLAKTSDYSVVDDATGSTGYVHYQIVVNGSHVPSKNLTVTDDLKALETEVLDANGKHLGDIDQSKWTIANSGGQAIKVTKIPKGGTEEPATNFGDPAKWVEDRKIEAHFPISGEETTDSYKIDLYLTLDKDALNSLRAEKNYEGELKIKVKNTATANSDDFLGGEPPAVECIGGSSDNGIDSKLVAKSVDKSELEKGILTYRINVNPNGSDMKNVRLTDVPDAALSIDLSSVKLCLATHEPGGAISDTPGDLVESGWTKKLVHDTKTDSTALSVTLPDGTASYVLEYKAKVGDRVKGGKVSNKITLEADGDVTGSDVCDVDVAGSSWGWLDKAAIYTLVKADEFGEKASPIAGVTFNLYNDAARTNLVTTAVSNAKGLVTFYGLEPGVDYFYDEVGKVDGYAGLLLGEDDRKFTAGGGGSKTVADKATLNKRTTDSDAVVLTKEFEHDVSDTLDAPQSEFALYLYPNGFNGGKKVAVNVTGADGAYVYDALNAGTAALVNKAAGGTLKITGLPWGDYGLEETAAQPGYTVYEGMKYFSVVPPVTEGDVWSVNYKPENVPGKNVSDDATITNTKTKITITKQVNGTEVAVPGAEFSIMDATGADVIKNSFTGDDYTWTPDGNPWEVVGLPAGTYLLRETSPASNTNLAKAKDTKFTIAENGSLTLDDHPTNVTADGNDITVNNLPCSITVKKLDQWGKGVAGAELTLKKKNASDNWDTVKSWKTASADDAEKGYTFSGLERGGTYQIQETLVPEGYDSANHAATTVGGLIPFPVNLVTFDVDAYGVVDNPVWIAGPKGDTPADGSHGIFQGRTNGNDFTVRNERIVGHAEFVKYDSSSKDKPLAGVKFDLYLMKDTNPGADDTLVNSGGYFTSDSQGKVTTVGSKLTNNITGEYISNGLAPGKYYFKEVSTHSDFVFDSIKPLITSWVTINEDNAYTWNNNGDFGSAVTVTKTKDDDDITNMPLNASVRVLKATDGDDSRALNGATFTLSGTDVNGKSVNRTAISEAADTTIKVPDSTGVEREFTTTDDGEALFGNVPAGTYTVKETVPPPGYKLNPLEFTVTVDHATAGKTYTLNSGKAVINEQNKFSIDKVDALATGTSLSGAVFELTGEFASGTSPIIWTSDGKEPQEPHVITGKLKASTNGAEHVYTLTEITPPEHYVIAAPIELKIDANGQLYQRAQGESSWSSKVSDNKVVVKDDPVRGHVELTKTVEGDGTAEGAEFSLFKKGDKADGSDDKLIAAECSIDSSTTWTSVGNNSDNTDTGQSLSEGLAVGIYYFVETKATPDTVLDSMTKHEFEITDDDHYATTSTAVSVVAENKTFSADLTLNKYDGTSGELLPGAKFKLTYTPEGGGDATEIELTSAKGTSKASNLKKGDYTLEEIAVPNGYKDAFSATFTLTDADNGGKFEIKEGSKTAKGDVVKTSGTWTSGGVTNTRIPGTLTLLKVDKDDPTYVLNDTEFTIERTTLEGDSLEKMFNTGYTYASFDDSKPTPTNDGRLSIAGLEWGTYAITETEATPGHEKGDPAFTQNFTVGPKSDPVALNWDFGSITNAETDIQILKIDDGVPLGHPSRVLTGAKLSLTGMFAGETTETTKTWDSAGTPKLFEGQLIVNNEYTLRETGRVPGYLPLGDDVEVKFTVLDTGKIKITSNPEIDKKEVAKLSAGGMTLFLRNTRISADVELTKTRDNDPLDVLEGATFDLDMKDASGSWIKSKSGLVTGADGMIRIIDLAEGYYRFVETATLDDAVLNSDPIEFSVGPGEHKKTITKTMDNESFKTDVSLVKVDATTGENLAEAEFTLYKEDDPDTFVKEGDAVLSDANGAVSFHLTKQGTYRIQETKPAKGYKSDNPYTAEFTVNNTDDFHDKTLNLSKNLDQKMIDKYKLKVTGGTYHTNGNVSNERKLGSVALTKVDADTSAPLNGAEFTLFAKGTPDKSLGVFITGNTYTAPDAATGSAAADGALSIAGLEWGDYYLQETKAEGYQVPSDKLDFTIDADAVEPTPPKNFDIANTPITFSFTKMELYVEGCSDDSISGALASKETRPLAGAEFTVYTDEACTMVAQSVTGQDLVATSDADGKVAFSYIKAGTYYVKETKTPDAHVDNNAVYQLDVAADGTITRFAPAGKDGVLTEVANDVPRTDITIKKVSETDESKTLPNSTYGLYRDMPGAAPATASAMVFAASHQQLIATATTDADGILTFQGVLMDQEYTIMELDAPDGSLVSKNPISITFGVIDGNMTITSFENGSDTAKLENGKIVWKEPQVTVRLDKKTPEGTLLAGAKLQIVDAAGKVVVEPWTSSADEGHVVEGLLVAGDTYYLQELVAPAGYVKAEDVPFTVDDPKVAPDEPHTQLVEMTDPRIVPPGGSPNGFPPGGFLLQTGDPLGMLVAGVGGIAVCALGVAGVVALRRRRKN